MKKNVGGIDRILRFVIGHAIIFLGIAFESWWGLLGVIPILTGFFGYCGLYVPLGISTCKVKAEKQIE